MTAIIITQPASEPINLGDAKAHLRIDDYFEDSYLKVLIIAAREFAEGFVNGAFVDTTFREVKEGFPESSFYLDKCQAHTINSIKYIDPSGVEQTLAPEKYESRMVGELLKVAAVDGCWPCTKISINAVVIEYVAGFGEQTDVPQQVKSAVKILLGSLHENRENETIVKLEAVPMSAQYLLARYKEERI